MSKGHYLLFVGDKILVLQMKFFHKVGSMSTPITDAEKLIWGVIEAERPAFRCFWVSTLSLLL